MNPSVNTYTFKRKESLNPTERQQDLRKAWSRIGISKPPLDINNLIPGYPEEDKRYREKVWNSSTVGTTVEGR